jgi:hypothetical protein
MNPGDCTNFTSDSFALAWKDRETGFTDPDLDDSGNRASSTQPYEPGTSYWTETSVQNPSQTIPSYMFMPGPTRNASDDPAQKAKVPFTWRTKLPGFDQEGYQLEAARGLHRGTAIRDLSRQLEQNYGIPINDLAHDVKGKVRTSIYDSYRNHVNRDKAARMAKVIMIQTAVKCASATLDITNIFFFGQRREQMAKELQDRLSAQSAFSNSANSFATTQFSSGPSAGPAADHYEMPALYEVMDSPESFKKQTGSVLDHVPTYSSMLKTLHDEFFKSTMGSAFQKNKTATFLFKMQSKYCLAITRHYPLHMRKDPTEVQWVRGQPDAEEFQNWLLHNPGKVRFWVDAEDIHAEFLPDGA